MLDFWTFQLFSSCVNMYFAVMHFSFYFISLKMACICSFKNYIFLAFLVVNIIIVNLTIIDSGIKYGLNNATISICSYYCIYPGLFLWNKMPRSKIAGLKSAYIMRLFMYFVNLFFSHSLASKISISSTTFSLMN